MDVISQRIQNLILDPRSHVFTPRVNNFVNWVVLLKNPHSHNIHIQKIVTTENDEVKGPDWRKAIGVAIFDEDVQIAVIGTLLVLITGLWVCLNCCYCCNNCTKVRYMCLMVCCKPKEFFLRFFVIFFWNARDMIDFLDLTVRFFSFIASVKSPKVFRGGRTLAFTKFLHKLLIFVAMMVIVFFMERMIETIVHDLANLPNECDISERCCPDPDEEEYYLEDNVHIVRNSDYDISFGEQGVGDPEFVWDRDSACKMVGSIKFSQTKLDHQESDYERCLYSRYSYLECRINPDAVGDSRPICDPLQYEMENIPVWVKTEDACSTWADIKNMILVEVMYMVVCLTITKLFFIAPLSFSLDYFLVGLLGGKRKYKTKETIDQWEVNFFLDEKGDCADFMSFFGRVCRGVLIVVNGFIACFCCVFGIGAVLAFGFFFVNTYGFLSKDVWDDVFRPLIIEFFVVMLQDLGATCGLFLLLIEWRRIMDRNPFANIFEDSLLDVPKEIPDRFYVGFKKFTRLSDPEDYDEGLGFINWEASRKTFIGRVFRAIYQTYGESVKCWQYFFTKYVDWRLRREESKKKLLKKKEKDWKDRLAEELGKLADAESSGEEEGEGEIVNDGDLDVFESEDEDIIEDIVEKISEDEGEGDSESDDDKEEKEDSTEEEESEREENSNRSTDDESEESS